MADRFGVVGPSWRTVTVITESYSSALRLYKPKSISLKVCRAYQSVLLTVRRFADGRTAESEIRKLHHKYGYYLDKCLYKQVSILITQSSKRA